MHAFYSSYCTCSLQKVRRDRHKPPTRAPATPYILIRRRPCTLPTGSAVTAWSAGRPLRPTAAAPTRTIAPEGCISGIFWMCQFSNADPLLSLNRPPYRSGRRFPFESSSVPARKIGSSFISALRKLQDFIAWRRRAAHIVIHQQELAQLARIQRTRRSHRLLATARRFGSRVGVERRSRHVSARTRSGWRPTWSAGPAG